MPNPRERKWVYVIALLTAMAVTLIGAGLAGAGLTLGLGVSYTYAPGLFVGGGLICLGGGYCWHWILISGIDATPDLEKAELSRQLAYVQDQHIEMGRGLQFLDEQNRLLRDQISQMKTAQRAAVLPKDAMARLQSIMDRAQQIADLGAELDEQAMAFGDDLTSIGTDLAQTRVERDALRVNVTRERATVDGVLALIGQNRNGHAIRVEGGTGGTGGSKEAPPAAAPAQEAPPAAAPPAPAAASQEAAPEVKADPRDALARLAEPFPPANDPYAPKRHRTPEVSGGAPCDLDDLASMVGRNVPGDPAPHRPNGAG